MHDELGNERPPIALGPPSTGAEDLVIVPLCVIALAISKLLKAMLSILINILDYAFPILLQLMRIPLFTARMIGDGMEALFEGVVRCLPLSHAKRDAWRARVREPWIWFRRKISYQAFEYALHHVFEAGMGWVFRKCRRLTPRGALLVIVCALLWLPVSFGTATWLHVTLITRATLLPAWMQLLHPFATLIAKSKLLVLPVYPAAWPQANNIQLYRGLSSSVGIAWAFSLSKKRNIDTSRLNAVPPWRPISSGAWLPVLVWQTGSTRCGSRLLIR